jgi:hypothetical protein
MGPREGPPASIGLSHLNFDPPDAHGRHGPVCVLGQSLLPAMACGRLPQANIECLAVINISRPRSGAVAIVTAIPTMGFAIYPWLFTGEIPG